MLRKEQRIHQLRSQTNRDWYWRYWGFVSSLVIAAVLAYQDASNLALVLVVMFFPRLCVEWRKTKLLLTFNEDRRYRRLIHFGFGLQWFGFVALIGMVLAYQERWITLVTLVGITFIILGSGELLYRTMNHAVQKIDAEHVTDKMVRQAETERRVS